MTIQRVVLFEVEGFRFKKPIELELGPRITFVYGPNASGKTSLTNALQSKLWPAKKSLYVSQIDPSALPQAAGTAEQYVLHLADVIHDASKLTNDILRTELAGGSPLAIPPTSETNRKKAREELLAAQRDFDGEVARLEALQQQIDRPKDLEDEIDATVKQRQRLGQYQLLIDLAEAERELAAATTELESLDERMPKVRAEDATRLKEIQRAIQDLNGKLDKAQQEVAETGITDQVNAPDVRQLKTLREEWQEATRRVTDAQSLVEGARYGLASLLQQYPALEPALELAIGDWEKAAREFHQFEVAETEVTSRAAVRDWLGAKVMAQDGKSLEDWGAERARLLNGFKPAPVVVSQVPWPWITVGVGVLAAAAVFFVPNSVVSAVIVLALLGFLAFALSRRSVPETQEIDWDALTCQLEEFYDGYARTKAQGELAGVLSQAQVLVEEAERNLPAAPEWAQGVSSAGLLLAEGKHRLSEAQTQLAKAEGGLAATEDLVAEKTNNVQDRLSAWRIPAVESIAELDARIDQLEKGIRARELASQITEQLDTARRQLGEFRDRLNTVDEFEVTTLANELPRYEKAKSRVTVAQERVRVASEAVAAKVSPDLPDRNGPEHVWAERLGEDTTLEQRETTLRKELAELEAEINQAKADRSLELLAKQVEEKKLALEAAEQRLIQAKLRSHFAEKINRAVRALTVPDSVTNAKRLFQQLSGGRYLLQTDEDAAYVNDQQEGRKELAQLSSGTAIQLLLSLRVGYLQAQERGGYAAPLILDEVLATTDAGRGKVIASALAEISKDRQVIYFTATNQERDWFNPEVTRFESLSPVETLISVPVPVTAQPEVPAPTETESVSEYRARLRALPIDPYSPIEAYDPAWICASAHRLFQARVQGAGSVALFQELNGVVPEEAQRRFALEFAAELWKIGRPANPVTLVQLRTIFGTTRAEVLIPVWNETGGDGKRFQAAALQAAGVGRVTVERIMTKLTEEGIISELEPYGAGEFRARLVAGLGSDQQSAAIAEEIIGAYVACNLMQPEATV